MKVEELMMLLEEVPYNTEIQLLITLDNGRKALTTNLGSAFRTPTLRGKFKLPAAFWLLAEDPWKPVPEDFWLNRIWPI